MRCITCSFENPDHARFCNQCGTDLTSHAADAHDRSFYERIQSLDPLAPCAEPYGAAADHPVPGFAATGRAPEGAHTVPFAAAVGTQPLGAAPSFDGNITMAFPPSSAGSGPQALYPDGTPYDGPVEKPQAFCGELSRAEARRLKREQRALDKEARRQQREQRKEQQRVEREEMKLLAAAEGARSAPQEPRERTSFDGAKPPAGKLPSMPSLSDRRRKRIVILVAVLLCILAAAAAFATYSLQLWGGKAVPEVVGLSSEAAAQVLGDAGFAVKTEEVRSDEAPGTVLGCVPSVGYRVEPGSTVTLSVATSRTVPEVVGKTQAEAEALIAEEGLENVTFDFQRSDEAADVVLSVAPAAGSNVLSSTAVTVVVAQPYTVPDVVGKAQEEAKAVVEQAGFVAAVTRVNDEEAEEGTVLSIDPAAGEKRTSGTTVTLSVAHHRSAEAIELTRKFLTDSKEMTIKGQACVVDEVKSITYAGDNVCEFSIVMRPYETHTWMFGWGTETRYGNPETVTGRIQWNDEDDVVSVEPSMKQGA